LTPVGGTCTLVCAGDRVPLYCFSALATPICLRNNWLGMAASNGRETMVVPACRVQGYGGRPTAVGSFAVQQLRCDRAGWNRSSVRLRRARHKRASIGNRSEQGIIRPNGIALDKGQDGSTSGCPFARVYAIGASFAVNIFCRQAGVFFWRGRQ
jgi:hypothetical protein